MRQSDSYLTKLDNAINALEDLVAAHPIGSRDNDVKGLPLDDSLMFFFELTNGYKKLDELRKQVYHRLDAHNKHIIPNLLETSGSGNKDGTRIRISNTEGRSFRILTKYGAKVNDKEALYKWLNDRGDGELIQETVNSGTLATYLKGLMNEEGIDAPPEIAELTSYNTVGMTKYQIKE